VCTVNPLSTITPVNESEPNSSYALATDLGTVGAGGQAEGLGTLEYLNSDMFKFTPGNYADYTVILDCFSDGGGTNPFSFSVTKYDGGSYTGAASSSGYPVASASFTAFTSNVYFIQISTPPGSHSYRLFVQGGTALPTFTPTFTQTPGPSPAQTFTPNPNMTPVCTVMPSPTITPVNESEPNEAYAQASDLGAVGAGGQAEGLGALQYLNSDMYRFTASATGTYTVFLDCFDDGTGANPFTFSVIGYDGGSYSSVASSSGYPVASVSFSANPIMVYYLIQVSTSAGSYNYRLLVQGP
jgi:hypothetical protein